MAGNAPSSLAPGTQVPRHFAVTRTTTISTDYLLYLPKDYSASLGQRYPLIFFLHGAGERGSDIWLVAKHGPPKLAASLTNFPFIVVSPQCPSNQLWSNEALLALLDDVERRYEVDLHRVYLTGLSMGGFGTWSLGVNYPDRFAAMAPLCGGGDYISPYLAEGARKAALLSLPVWAFHGGADPVVPTAESRRMVDLLKKLGAHEVKLTVYPGVTHNCWTQTYNRQDLYDWFLQHSR